MELSELAKDQDYLGLPETERAKVVEHLTKQDQDFHALPDAEKVKVLNHFVSLGSPQPATNPVNQLRMPEKSKSYGLSELGSDLADLGKGALSGVADVGNTLINASTFVPRTLADAGAALYGQKEASPLTRLNNARQEGLQSFNEANKDNVPFTVGRVGGNIAGTAGAGGVAGGALKALSKTPQALALAESIANSGTTGTLANRVAGGATSGALGSLLVDPESTGTGALVGGGIPVAGKAIPAIGSGVANVVGGIGTHTGGESLKTAANAGMQGGKQAKSFANNMRGNVPMTDVLETAKQNLQTMGKAKQAEYRTGMADISNDKSVLNFDGIDNSLNNALDKITFKGQVKNAKGAEIYQKIADEVNKWKSLDPAEYHTPEGLDALKQKIGGIVESIPFEEKTARSVAGDVYNSIKSEINKQAPAYAKVMKNYSEASEQIAEIESALLSRKSPDAAMRKLQSIMRNNVNTNYGNRLDLAKKLETQGGQEILPALAGQSLSSWTPRGLGGAVAGATGAASIISPQLIPILATQSPRLMGEAALKTGQLARLLKSGADTAAPASGALGALLNR